ncbi:MAG: hypothetical protein QM737_18625 [Ferruginibacter sp.]
MKQGVICILDILGTKGIWTEESVEQYFKIISEIEKNNLNPAKEHFLKIKNDMPIELDFISFSDTLVVTLTKTITEEKKDQNFFKVVIDGFTLTILGIFQTYFADSLFLRGAISYGQIEKRGSHFVGPAVDDAAEYFELQDMIGICLTPKATIAMDYAIGWNKKVMSKEIGSNVIKYKTPLKNKMEADLYQINWPKPFHDLYKHDNEITPENILSNFMSKRNIPPIALSKFTNTFNFYNYVTKNFR